MAIGSASSASGSWARGWRRTLRAAGFELTVWNRTARKGRAVGGATTARPSPTAPPRWRGASDVVITMVVDGAQVETVLLGADGVAEGARGGPALRRHVDDRAGRRAADRRRAGRARTCASSTRR